MPNKCSVVACRGNYEGGPKVSLFQFPKDEDLQKKWLVAIRRKDFKITKNSRVCNLHFKDTDVLTTTEIFDEKNAKLIVAPLLRPRLRNGSVPSIFPGSPLYISSANNMKQCPKRKKEKMDSKNVSAAIPTNLIDKELKSMTCYVVDCNHYSEHDSCRFFRFPKNEKCKKIWIRNIRRVDRSPTNSSRVCSCHFENGDKSKTPTIFERNKRKILRFPSPERRRRRKKQPTSETDFKSEAEKEEKITKVLVEPPTPGNKEVYVSFSIIENDEVLVFAHTGLPNAKVFYSLVNYCKRFEIEYFFSYIPVTNIPLQDQVFVTLQVLRKNYSFDDLAVPFSVHPGIIKNIFFTFLHVFHEALYEFMMRNVPDLSQVQKMCPSDVFPDCRFLVDCVEVSIEKPCRFKSDKKEPPNIKEILTFKAVIAVAPNGTLCFASDLYPMHMHDKDVFGSSGLLELLSPKDLIIAHKAHFIHDILPKGVSLNIPPFLLNGASSHTYIRTIEKARIHVQRSIDRIKCFSILHCIPKELGHLASIIFQVCSVLVNFQSPYIKFSDEIM